MGLSKWWKTTSPSRLQETMHTGPQKELYVLSKPHGSDMCRDVDCAHVQSLTEGRTELCVCIVRRHSNRGYCWGSTHCDHW